MINTVPLVQFVTVSKSFGNTTVLDGLSLSIDEGEFAVVFGLSGSGKSVLLRTLLGLETPDSGTLFLRGSDAVSVKPGDRKIGYVPQSFALFPGKTVAENIAYPLTVTREPKSTVHDAVERVARLLDIAELLDRTPGQLSGGQKQRVAIARGLALSTDLYVLDDPLVGLDFKLREKLIDDLRETREALGVTFLYATADATEALALATNVAVLSDGAIQEFGRPRDVYANPEHVVTMMSLCFPQCNRLPATYEQGEIVTSWGRVTTPVMMGVDLADDVDVLVRPEHVDLNPSSGGYSVIGRAAVVLREDLGAEEVVYLESDGIQLTSLMRAGSSEVESLSLGDVVEFGIRSEAFVLFSGGHRVGQGRS